MGAKQRGAVLILVLWVLLAMSLLALSFSAAIRTEVEAARNVVEQKQAFYMARAGIEYAVYRVIQSQYSLYQAQQPQPNPTEMVAPVLDTYISLELADGGAQVEVVDETGKININLAPPHLIYNLLVVTGTDPSLADGITDALTDWKDPDDLISPNGAESDYYQSLAEPYLAKNGFLDVPEEMLLVRGVTPEIYYGRKALDEAGNPVEYFGLQKYFTTFSNINRINVNSAPLAVLASIPGLGFEDAQLIVSLRQAAPVADLTEIAERIPGLPTETLNYFSILRSNVYSLKSLGHILGSDVVSRIQSVIRVDGQGPRGYSILYWNESNIEL